ncbi:AraC family transcriptional regulator [Yoonia sp.]|uniref:helix-turn-helix domain-containing protein n=1 Tax=Yoonia sp. TaxID=2212373 RepID=UPI0025EAC233|nr:AraC family transcriptional regulator [Yoonia sp.]
MIQTGSADKPALALAPLSFGGAAARWRHETMRSHDSPRLIHVTKGQGRVTVAGLTGGYGPNNLIYLPAQTLYGIELGTTVFAQILTLPDGESWPTAPFHLRLRDVHVQKELQGLIEAIERDLKPAGDPRAAQFHLGLLGLFVEKQCATQHPDTIDKRRLTPAARLVARYCALIARDFQRGRTVADYAADVGVTSAHLTRCCKKTCDRSALALLHERVHFAACTLLRDTRLPIRDIASSLGFRSAAYFTRRFQAMSGHAPSAFRRHDGKVPRL